ncbi:MAG TPA: amidohydrolase family protein, partial [Candidatus Limnocylindrales bacterium]|nr:amidohydrolase family protein [Candidatus Limnocylindrales bacterium]
MSLFADHLLVNGRIVTLDKPMLRATALATRAGWIVGVGSTDELGSLRGPQTQVIDLQGATVLPGLVDAHIHWQRYSESLAAVNLFQVP